jgi:hypothetical protein
VLHEGASPVLGDDQRAQDGVPGIEAIVLEDDLVEVGVAHAGHGLPVAAAVVGSEIAEVLRQGPLVRMARADHLPLRIEVQLEERPHGGALAAGLDRPSYPADLVALRIDAEEATVRRQHELAGVRVSLQRVDERRPLREVDQPVRAPGRLRGVAAARRAAGGRQREPEGALHPCAAASSHSARVVKPTITASIQYWERTAKRDPG